MGCNSAQQYIFAMGRGNKVDNWRSFSSSLSNLRRFARRRLYELNPENHFACLAGKQSTMARLLSFVLLSFVMSAPLVSSNTTPRNGKKTKLTFCSSNCDMPRIAI